MPPLDLGHGVELQFTSYGEHERAGYIQSHPRPDGQGRCEGGGLFDLPGIREAFPDRAVWQVESWEPLTLSPSLLCSACGHHGFIRGGRWVPA
jgi:hypothetical protein